MTNNADIVKIIGSFVMQSERSHDGKLSAGIMEIGGDLVQQRSSRNFCASGNHTVLLNGNSKQTVDFYSSNSNSSRINNLVIENVFIDGSGMCSALIYYGGALMKKAKKIFLGFAILLFVLHWFFIVSFPLIYPILKRTFSTEYKKCYDLIADDFETANQNNLFKVENAILRGSYYYSISAVKNNDMTSQDYFDEYVFFTQRLINSLAQDLDNQLLNECVSLSFEYKEGKLKRYVTIMAVRKRESTDIKIWAETNVFADYNSLNDFVSGCKIEDVQLSLNETDFTQDEKNTIGQQKKDFLFKLEWAAKMEFKWPYTGCAVLRRKSLHSTPIQQLAL